MFYRLYVCLILSVVLVLSVCCTRLGEPGASEQKLVVEKLAQPDSIPAKWGKLVGASSCPSIEDQAQLWFQDDEGNIRIVGYDVCNHRLADETIVIHRN